MTLSAPTRLDASRGTRPPDLTHPGPAARPTAPGRTAVPFFPAHAAPAPHILVVEFASPDGRTSQAIGGGDTLAAAIAFAQDSCPADTTWRPVSWNDLYGK
jgi:hypothetical protein